MAAPEDSMSWTGERLTKEFARDYVTVVAVFPNVEEAHRGLRALRDAGFDRDDLALVAKGTDATSEIPAQAASDQAAHRAAAGAAIGGVTGGLIMGLIGAGLLVVPGAGPFLAAGWIATAVGGALTGGAAGGWIGATTQIGVPEDVSRRYQDLISQGHQLVMVLAQKGDLESRARQVLSGAGASDVQAFPYVAAPGGRPGASPSVEGHPLEDVREQP
ncbi:MAG TPA: general stress protein [Thermomicrobiaceae bacterium]|nr:general stress protein [Thermomicrobiaceae bacterium]